MTNDNKALERAEIIAALQYCASGDTCEGCPLGQYDGITCAGFSAMLRKAASLLERDAEPPNAPLTIEELWGMYGEPVWVELLNRDIPCGTNSIVWASMRGATNGYIRFPFKKYKKTWLAYRRRPDRGGE